MTFSRAKPLGFVDDVVLPASELNIVDINQSRGLDGTAGGNYTPVAALGIGGGGLRITEVAGAPSNVMLASRAVLRQQSLVGCPEVFGAWRQGVNGTWSDLVVGIGNEVLCLYLHNLPLGNVLQSVTVRYRGAVGHVNSPIQITAPIVRVYTIDGDNAAVSIGGPVSDPTCALVVGAPAAYQAWHDITVPAMAHTINTYSYRYVVKVTSEVVGAEPFIPGANVCQVFASVDCTRYSEF